MSIVGFYLLIGLVFGLVSLAVSRLAPAIGYQKFGGTEPALYLIRISVWIVMYMGAFALTLACIFAYPQLALAIKLAAGAGVFYGFALCGPTARDIK